MSFISKLRERKVVRMAIIYCFMGWGVLQVADIVVSVLELPTWTLRATFVLIVLFFPLALVLAWVFRISPQGLELEVEPGKFSLRPQSPRPADRESASSAEPADRRPAVAVLPFHSKELAKPDEYLSDGVAGEILHCLASTGGLRVPSHTCCFRLKGTDCSARESAAKLCVDHILKGTIGSSGGGLKLSVELVNTVSDTVVWSHSYAGLVEDIPSIEEKIARGVSHALKVDSDAGTRTPRRERRPANPDAYLAYLQGRHALHEATADSCRRAVSFFQDAIALEDNFPRAWAGLSLAYTWLTRYGLMLPSEGFGRAKLAAQKALGFDEYLAEAHLALAAVQLSQEWNFAGAETSLRRAVELEPDSAEVHLRYGHYLSIRGRWEQAVSERQRAVDLDPLLENAHQGLADTLFLAGRYSEALKQLLRIEQLSPNFPTAHLRARIALAQGEPGEALTRMEQEKLDWRRLYISAIAHFREGEVDTARHALEQLIDRYSDEGAFQIAIVYAQMGEPEHAFDWLHTALDNRDPGFIELQTDPELEPLRSDPRFNQLIDAAGLGNCRDKKD